MSRYKVLAVVNNEEFRIDLKRRLGKEDEIALVGFANMDTKVLAKISSYTPHVVLLVNSKGDSGIMELSQMIYREHPGCAIVLITKDCNMATLNEAMLSGIRRVVYYDELDTLKESIIEAAVFENARVVDAGRDPRVVSVYGASGGSGKTTVAVNLATSLAKAGRRTAIIDLCLHFGDVDLLLNIKAKDTIAELVQEKNDFNIDDIKSFSMKHTSGLTVLCAPSSPKYAEYITEQHVETIISIMRPYFDFIIIDLPCDLSDCNLAAIENSDDVLLITKRDIPSLRATKSMMNILTTLHQNEKASVIINLDQKSVLKNSDFERVLDVPVTLCIPEDVKTAKRSQECGEPFVSMAQRTPISRSITKLAKYCVRMERKKAK